MASSTRRIAPFERSLAIREKIKAPPAELARGLSKPRGALPGARAVRSRRAAAPACPADLRVGADAPAIEHRHGLEQPRDDSIARAATRPAPSRCFAARFSSAKSVLGPRPHRRRGRLSRRWRCSTSPNGRQPRRCRRWTLLRDSRGQPSIRADERLRAAAARLHDDGPGEHRHRAVAPTGRPSAGNTGARRGPRRSCCGAKAVCSTRWPRRWTASARASRRRNASNWTSSPPPRSQLATLVLQPVEGKPGERDQRVQALGTEIDALESALASSSRDLAAELQAVNLADIQKQLPADTVLVEYRAVSAHSIRRSSAAPIGSARRGSRSSRCVRPARPSGWSWDRADVIEGASPRCAPRCDRPADRDPRPAARELARLILDPVEPQLRGARRVLVASDGELSVIPFAALRDTGGRFLIERVEVVNLASGRDLLRVAQRQPSREGAVIVANPNFDAGTGPAARRRSARSPPLPRKPPRCAPFSPMLACRRSRRGHGSRTEVGQGAARAPRRDPRVLSRCRDARASRSSRLARRRRRRRRARRGRDRTAGARSIGPRATRRQPSKRRRYRRRPAHGARGGQSRPARHAARRLSACETGLGEVRIGRRRPRTAPRADHGRRGGTGDEPVAGERSGDARFDGLVLQAAGRTRRPGRRVARCAASSCSNRRSDRIRSIGPRSSPRATGRRSGPTEGGGPEPGPPYVGPPYVPTSRRAARSGRSRIGRDLRPRFVSSRTAHRLVEQFSKCSTRCNADRVTDQVRCGGGSQRSRIWALQHPPLR